LFSREIEGILGTTDDRILKEQFANYSEIDPLAVQS
jgi:hypothetical protein